MIRLDVSTTSVVVKCSECPHWYAFAWTKEAGQHSADNHLVAVHDAEPARRAGDRERKRHAQKQSE